MTDIEINKIWSIIVHNYEKYLNNKGIKLPKLIYKNRYTKNALTLIKLAENYPNTKIVSKTELTDFIRKFYPDVKDVQQARHLSMQSGWNIASGTRGDNIPYESYKLIDLENTYPAFVLGRREQFKGNFNKIKEFYNYRCANCGSKENEEHLFRKGVKVKLQKGHMNPNLKLEEGNIIPQCQICNRADRNRWIYDKTGRVVGIANTEDGFKVVLKFIKNSSYKTKLKLLKSIKQLKNDN